MNNLFKKPEKAQRVARAEVLDASRGIFMSMTRSADQKDYNVVLCLANETKKTTFHCEAIALDQMRKYRELYKEIKRK